MEQALYWVVGAIGMPLISLLKNKLGWEGKPAMWLTIGMSFILAILAMFLVGDLKFGADFSFEGIVSVLGQVLAAATLAYKLITEKKE